MKTILNAFKEFREYKLVRNTILMEFEQAEAEWNFIHMQDLIEQARKIEYLNLANELQERYNAVYNNPSKELDYSNENF